MRKKHDTKIIFIAGETTPGASKPTLQIKIHNPLEKKSKVGKEGKQTDVNPKYKSCPPSLTPFKS